MTDKQRKNLELVKSGFANGISTQLANKQAIEGPDARLTDDEKQHIIKMAAFYYGEFLKALGVDWEKDPNSDNTPKRVAKAMLMIYGKVVMSQCQILLHFRVMVMMALCSKEVFH